MTPPRAHPVVFEGLAGRFHSAAGEVAVLMVGAWGYEQFCMARNWRLLAERFAAAGYPTLRYDHPGAGDSLDPADPGLAPLRAGVRSAVAALGRLARPRAIVLVGQGLGAALAMEAANETAEIAGLVALAPVTRGRIWLRELAAWSAMLGGAEPGRLSVGGFEMPEALAEDLRGLDLSEARPAVAVSLLAARPGQSGAGFGRTLVYEGHEAAVAAPTDSVEPARTFAAVVAGLVEALPPGRRETAPALETPAVLVGDGFTETVLRFGPDDRLWGVLTEPTGGGAATALFLNSGFDPHEGWARIAVEQARRLAAAGFASLRIDQSRCGETPEAAAEIGAQLLYDRPMIDDGAAALDLLGERAHGPIVVVGRCSGAFHGFHLAVERPDVAGLMMINPLRLVWDPRETFAEAVRQDVRCRALREQGLVGGSNLKRLMSGEIGPRAIARRIVDLVASRLPTLPWSQDGRLVGRARGMFQALADRGCHTLFVSADGDASRDRFADVFGEDGGGAIGLAGFEPRILVEADHNLNRRAARAQAGDALIDLMGRVAAAGRNGA